MGLEFDICEPKLSNQFFFFSVESLTLTKMNCLTIKQCIKIIKTSNKNGDSAAVTYRALRGDYGLHKNREQICRDWSGYNMRSAENIAIVNECVAERPNV